MTLYDKIDNTLEAFKRDYSKIRNVDAEKKRQILAERLETAVLDYVDTVIDEISESYDDKLAWVLIKVLLRRLNLSELQINLTELHEADQLQLTIEEHEGSIHIKA